MKEITIPLLITLSAPVAGLATMVLLHVAASRAGSMEGHLRRFVATFLCGFALTLAATLLSAETSTWADTIARAVLNCAAFSGLAYGYFTFVNLTATSLRLRLLRDIRANPAQPVPTAALLRRYDTSRIVEARLERLLGWGQMQRNGDRLIVHGTPLFLVLARIVRIWRWVVTGRTTPPGH
jgi:hypothetical protein